MIKSLVRKGEAGCEDKMLVRDYTGVVLHWDLERAFEGARERRPRVTGTATAG